MGGSFPSLSDIPAAMLSCLPVGKENYLCSEPPGKFYVPLSITTYYYVCVSSEYLARERKSGKVHGTVKKSILVN